MAKQLSPQTTRIKWRYGVLVGVFLVFCALYPQLMLWSARGSEWQGAYAYNDLDEVAYAAYLQGLIDGRPRRHNPYFGRDDAPEEPQRESLFSVQFLAPYLIALPARMFGVSASTALIWTGAITAFAAALAVFWLASLLVGDSRFAAVAALVTLCCGVLVNGEGAIINLVSGYDAYPYFPFLRRYIPAVGFSIFFVFCAAVWQMLTAGAAAKRISFCVLAAVCFAVFVYSYFYLWTTAVAWLFCLTMIWIAARPDGWRRDLAAFGVLGAWCLLSLMPYALLLANRDTTMDAVQLLTFTRLPDLLRPPLIIGALAIVLLGCGVWFREINPSSKTILFIVSLAAVPLVVFNQQVVTGRSLQPIHYQVFIVNYVTLLALLLTIFVVWRDHLQKSTYRTSFGLLGAALAAASWGIIEAHQTSAALSEANVVRDEAQAVGKRLRELAETELFDETGARRTVLSFNLVQGDDQPTIALQATLWARHAGVFAGADQRENKIRFYQFLYYAGVDEAQVEQQLRDENFVFTAALFGWGRNSARLTTNFVPLSNDEITETVQSYAEFRANFDFQKASQPRLSYLVVDSHAPPDFENVDRWYERDAGESHGRFVLYTLQLLSPASSDGVHRQPRAQ